MTNTATKTAALVSCPKCSGTGRIRAFSHIENGVCFLCAGNGDIVASRAPMAPAPRALDAAGAAYEAGRPAVEVAYADIVEGFGGADAYGAEESADALLCVCYSHKVYVVPVAGGFGFVNADGATVTKVRDLANAVSAIFAA